jgi:hypothetical protein
VATAEPPPATRLEVAFEVQPPSIVAGQTARLQWSVPGAEEVVIAPDIGRVRPAGQTVVKPNDTTTYRLQARAGNATGSREVTVQVQQPQKPAPVKPEISFQATPPSIPAGGAATLSWTLQGAVAANIAPEPGALHQTSGRARVTPGTTTTYVLTARSKDGTTDTATATVQVTQSGPGPGPGPGQVRGSNTSLITVVHDHAGALNATTWPSCYGALQVTNGVLRYAVAGTLDGRKDGFEIPIAQVQDIALNRANIKNQPAFHIVVRGQHLNFVSTGMAAGQAVTELKAAMSQR